MFSNSVKLFTLRGFDIRLDPSWILIAALITWSLSRQYFPYVLPDQSSETYVLMGLVAMLLFFGSLVLHELAHAVVARRFGVPIKGITLFLFGGVAELEAEPRTPDAELLVALAGPAMSISLSFGFSILASISEMQQSELPVTETLNYLATINLVLAVFNLVPAYPLDGGRVLRALLWKRSGNMLKATQTAAKAGTIFAYVLMTLGLVALFQGAVITGLWQILIGSFLLFAARSSYQSQFVRAAMRHKSVGALMTPKPSVVDPSMTLAGFVDEFILKRHINFAPVVEDGVLLGHMDRALLKGIDRENWEHTQVGDIFVGLAETPTVGPDVPVKELVRIMTETGSRKFLVVRDHELLGVVTLADLAEALQSENDHGIAGGAAG
jgi:Zn-dependent protease/CBS domain-containing protein